MAGIGFELQKVLKGGGIANLFKVAMAGIVIVAGPWLVSIVGIYFLNRFASFALTEGADLFMAAIVYSYAFSLSLFGGFHYIFTRYISDLIYVGHEGRAVRLLLIIMGITALLSGFIALGPVLLINTDSIDSLNLYRIAAVLLFITINLIWLVMLFVTLLKKYMTILFVYFSGMAVSFGAVFFLGGRFGLGGALLGYTAGQLFILLYLLSLVVMTFRPQKEKGELKGLLGYFRKFRYLFLAGLFYSLGIWVDKMILWGLQGSAVGGSWFRLYEHYDITIYFANLTMIPGMVYFMVFSETDFYSILRKFLLTIEKSILTRIREEKYRLIRSMNRSLYEQSFFQGIITAGLILIAPAVNRGFLGGQSDPVTIRLVLAAVFFHLFFLTVLTFLFYIELYGEAFISALMFFLVNGLVTVFVWKTGLPLTGTGYLAAAVAASLLSFLFLRSGMRNLDRRMYGRL